MEIPLIELHRVLHAGNMDIRNLGRNSGGQSFEGHNLSVSLCPHAWRAIARLGSSEIFELTRHGGLFIDATKGAAERTEDWMITILEWANDEGLVTFERRWRSWHYDDEADGWRFCLHETEESALNEIEAENGDHIDDPILLPTGTQKLIDLTGMNDAVQEASDAAIVAWAMIEAPRILRTPIDGVWWRERFDPEALSAPRGLILKDRVSAWTCRRARALDIDDEVELGRMPMTRGVLVVGAPGPLRG